MRLNEVSDPFKSTARLLPSVIYILIELIVCLLIGLYVILLGSRVKLYDGLRTLVLKYKAVNNVTFFSINKTIIYQVTMNIEDVSILRKIWYFCAYIIPGCCENFFYQIQSAHKNWIFSEINLVVSLQLVLLLL